MDFSPEQNAALNAKNSNILISAGAGSGKTRVLTERILRYLKNGNDISRLLVLTFTKLAAAEMKGRIRKGLLNDESLKEQLLKLESSDITNFDSFALSFVKKYYYVLDNVSNNIQIADGAFFIKKERDFLRSIFDEYYANNDEEFYDILINNAEKNDNKLFDCMLNIYSKLCLKSNFNEYMDKLKSNHYEIKDSEELYHEFMKSIRHKLDEIKDLYDKFYDDLIFLEDIDFTNFLEMNEYDDIKTYLMKNLTLPRKPKSCMYGEEYTLLRKLYKKLDEVFIYEDKTELINELTYSARHGHFFYKTLIKLNDLVMDYKKKINLYEFSDIAKMAIAILKNNPSIRLENQNKYDEILIDEYQDTSDLQEEFVKLIAKDNIFMVGDVKQSIYRFRNANPEIFKQKYIAYSENNGGQKIDLTNNYRSREGVINSINHMFDLLMDLEFGGADYQKSHHMNAENIDYKTSAIKSQSCLKVLHYDNTFKLDNVERSHIEAFVIARDIKQKIADGYEVMDDETKKMRPCTYKDFVLITSTGSSFNNVREIFEYEQIPLQVFQNESVAKSYFLNDLKNLLLLYKCIYQKAILKEEVNSYELSYAFTAIAKSVLSDLSDQEIFDVVSSRKYYETDIYQRMQTTVYNHYNDSNINIFNAILKEFDVYNRLVKDSNVNDASVAIEFVIRSITSLEVASLSFIDFVDYLSNVINDEYKLEYPGVLEDTNSVTLMNIHKSKGLEYKIIYYYDLAKGFNMQDQKAPYNFYDDYGFLVSNMGSSPLKLIANYYETVADISERIRLFYVALTRAKEEIILVTGRDLNSEDAIKRKIDFRSFDDLLSYMSDYFIKLDLIEEVSLDNVTNAFLEKEKINEHVESEKAFKETISIPSSLLEKGHASNTIKEVISKKEYQTLNAGTKFHEIFETMDLKHPDYTHLDEYHANKVKAFLKQVDVSNATIYQEHEFIFNFENRTIHGIIDLLLEYEDYFVIIDYKLANADAKKYREQLKVYKSYINSISSKKVITKLYSILDEELVEVNL